MREPSALKIATIGLHLTKNVVQLHAVDAEVRELPPQRLRQAGQGIRPPLVAEYAQKAGTKRQLARCLGILADGSAFALAHCGAGGMKQDYAAAGVEPPLDEVLHDPVVELVMKRDGLEQRDIRRVIAVARRRLLQRRAASGRHPGAAR